MPAANTPVTNSAVAVWEGDLRSRVTAGDREFAVDADADGSSPTDFLLVSLASCYAAALGWQARKRRVELPDLSVTATGTYHGLRFGHILLTVSTNLPADELDRLIQPALRVCYVSNTITTSATIEVAVG